MGQQSVPEPRIRDLRRMDQTVRRAREYRDFEVRLQAILAERLGCTMYSDSSLANIRKVGTQASFIIGEGEEGLGERRALDNC